MKRFVRILAFFPMFFAVAAVLLVLWMRTEEEKGLSGNAWEAAAGDLAVEEAAGEAAGSLAQSQPGKERPGTETAVRETEASYAPSLAASLPVEGYAYTQLTGEAQILYREIYASLMGFEKDTPVSTLDGETLRPVFDCVMADHPEIFWVDGYQYASHMLGEEVCGVTFSGSFTQERQEAEMRRTQVERAVRPFLESLAPDLEDYDKLLAIYTYVVKNTRYDRNAPESQNICSVFLNGASVCQGYAAAFQYLCLRAGIPCALVPGTVESGESHAWNLVYSGGDWYWADPTWGDADYLPGVEGEALPARPEVNYDFFLVTTQQLERTHTPRAAFPLPVCTASADNYYVREGTLLDQADLELAAALFERAYARGETVLTLKCTKQSVYEELERLLLKEQGLFRLLQASDRAAYALSPERLTLTFWL